MSGHVGARASRLFALVLLALLAGLASGQARAEKLRAEHQERAWKLLHESGQRHLDLGLALRDQGLVAQAAEQIRLAVELSERQHAHANAVLALMRRYDDAFWKRRVTATEKRLDAYEKKARKLEREDREARHELAEWAWKKGLAEEARADFERLLAGVDQPLELDSKERVVLDTGPLPEELSAELVAAAVTINGLLYRRDAFLASCPSLDGLHEHASERLRVRCQTSVADARALHALGEALLPHLEAELGGRPARRLGVFVFSTRADYDAWLDASGNGAYRAVPAMAHVATQTAVVCAEELSLEPLHGLILHELSHVFDFAVSPARMPEWYREGLADSFGGQGAFRWDGEALEVGLALEPARLEALRAEGGCWSLDALFALDPLTLWAADRDAALRFYAQSWALYRFLTREADEDLRARFAEWLAACRGSLAGVSAPGQPDGAPDSAQLFRTLVAPDLPRLEEAFQRYLRGS